MSLALLFLVIALHSLVDVVCQAVLEDTMMKNIQLKESVKVLGQEIDRLSQARCSLQSSLVFSYHIIPSPPLVCLRFSS